MNRGLKTAARQSMQEQTQPAKHGEVEAILSAGRWQRRHLHLRAVDLDDRVPHQLLGDADKPLLIPRLRGDHRQRPLPDAHAYAVTRAQHVRALAIKRDPACRTRCAVRRAAMARARPGLT